MLKVAIEQTTTSMVLAQTIYHPLCPGEPLLKNGFQLDAPSIERLRSLHIPSLWIKFPHLESLDSIVDPAISEHKQDLLSFLTKTLPKELHCGDIKANYSRYAQKIEALIATISNGRGVKTFFVSEIAAPPEMIFFHSVTVAYLSILMGMRLEHYIIRQRPNISRHIAKNLVSLGVGCLLHDVGKLQLDDALHKFKITACDKGASLWQTHTEIGHELIKEGIDPTTAQIILNHHQHFDGSGFPNRQGGGLDAPFKPQSGLDIHIFCRIMAVADRFDGFAFFPDGSRAPTVVALKRMKNQGYRAWFDPTVLETFFQVVPPFPPGEQVVLNNGQRCVVKRLSPKTPCRPIVAPVDLAVLEGRPPEGEAPAEIDLSINPHLSIQFVDGVDVTKFLY